MLHKRYASPFSLLNNLIGCEQFSEYVQFLLNKEAEDKNNQALWEYYLHKVFDKSFDDFKNEVYSAGNDSLKNDATDEAKREEIMKKSDAILKNFVPIE